MYIKLINGNNPNEVIYMKLAKIGVVTACGIVVSIISGYFGYVKTIESEKNNLYNYNMNSRAVNLDQKITVGKDTILEFVYNYSDGFSEVQQLFPQYYMEGWTREEMIEAYDTWQMSEFSRDRIVFNKNMNCESSQHYTIKDSDGYIAVFYKNSDVLKEMTSTPIASLSEADQQLYRDGVDIDGEANLIRYLENLET